MDKIQLRNGVEMPMEGFGVFQVPERDCKGVVLDAIRAGCRLIDTASSYQNEEAVGEAIREAVAEGTVKRESLFLTTKAYIQEMGYDNLKAAFARSLDKLGLSYLDLYLIHMPLGDYYGAWRAMEELYREGKIRAIGVCNFDAARLMDLCYNADIRPMVDQIERHPHFQRGEDLAVMRKLEVQPRDGRPLPRGARGCSPNRCCGRSPKSTAGPCPRSSCAGTSSKASSSSPNPSTGSGWRRTWLSGTLPWTTGIWSGSRAWTRAAPPCWTAPGPVRSTGSMTI